MPERHESDMERMRAARRRLAQARQRVRRLSWMARDPESLDAEVPLLSRTAFVRALARFQTIRLRRERAALLAFRVADGSSGLRRAVAMHLIENTRNCDTLGCADAHTFLVLLKGAGEDGARTALHRLRAELRELTAKRLRWLAPVHAVCMPLTPQADAATALDDILRRLREVETLSGEAAVGTRA